MEAKFLASSIHKYFSSADEYNYDPSIFPFEYKRQLNTIKESLLSKGKNWRYYYLEAQKLVQDNKLQDALINYERALALNPYHSNIVKQLEDMYVYSQNLKLVEHSENINALLESIW